MGYFELLCSSLQDSNLILPFVQMHKDLSLMLVQVERVLL